MNEHRAARRSAFAGSLAALAMGIVCLACVLPVIGGIVGISILVTAAGGVAEDGTLVVVGVIALIIGLALGAFVLVARRRSEPANR